MFKTHDEIVAYINSFDGIKYEKTRNYINGGVSRLSPYITHGVITTKEVITLFLQRYTIQQAEMLFKELLWREYFVQVHYRKRDGIFADMEEDKTHIRKHDLLPSSLLAKTTQSKWVNQVVLELEQTGYIHNHMRMWLASYCVHYGKLYWKKCADWTYYHFIDGELGSNHLSRQWVQSTFSHKPYFMNEENIMRYRPGQTEPALRGTYEEVEKILFNDRRGSSFAHDKDVVDTLVTDLSDLPHFDANRREQESITILSPRDWHPTKCSKPDSTICILDERFFAIHPRSAKRIAFIEQYAKHYGITIYKGNLDTILSSLHQANKQITLYETRNPYYREAYEHATQLGATCIAHERASPLVTKGYTKKFFPFWEKSAPHLYAMQREIGKNLDIKS